MFGVEDVIMSEIAREDVNEQGLPPGFRFHPTDEELVKFYLASKVFKGSFFTAGIHIAEVDLNKCEPWDLPDVAKRGEREWYFYSLRDRKYPTGVRTNRATGAGYWKATGKDREVKSSSSESNANGGVIGMKKTLVFYKGRAPRGEKTKWVMNEYRLHGHFSFDSYSYRHHMTYCKDEWVICRIVHKRGEKRNPLVFEGQSHHHLFEEAYCSSYSTAGVSLPPSLLDNATKPSILESQPPHNPTFDDDLMDHQIQLLYKQHTSHDHHHLPSADSESCFSPIINPTHPHNISNPSPSSSSILSLSHHQHPPTTNPLQYCKTEPNFSLFQPPSAANLRGEVDKVDQYSYYYYKNNNNDRAGIQFQTLVVDPTISTSVTGELPWHLDP